MPLDLNYQAMSFNQDLYCWNCGTSSSGSAAAKFSSNNLRLSEARKEQSFTIVRTSNSTLFLQRHRGSKVRLELLEVLTKVTLSGNH
jgi:hypothetical protein